MTDPRPLLSDDDLATVLDGTATTSTLDRLARDPASRARRDALAAAAAAVASPVEPLSDLQVDGLLARALATGPVFEAPRPDAAGSPPPAAPGGQVLALPPPARRLPPVWLVAAGVAVLMAIGLGLVWSGRDSGTADTAAQTSQDETTASEGQLERGEVDDNATAGAAPDATEPTDGEAPAEEAPAVGCLDCRLGAPTYLGDFATSDDLRDAVATAFPTTGPALGSLELPPDISFQRCGEQMRVQLSLDGEVTEYGYAEVDGVPTMVYEFGEDDPEVVTAVRADVCDPFFIVQR